MTKKVRFISFRLLLTMCMATILFNSCGKEDNETNPNTIAVLRLAQG